MTLQPDMAFAPARAVRGNGVVSDKLAVQRDFDRGIAGFDFERVPLAGRLGGEGRRRREGVDRAGLVRGIVVLTGRGD